MKAHIEALPDGAHKSAGRYDNAKRWYPDEEFMVPGTFDVRSPSRTFPYSYLKHFYSKKYAKALFWAKPLTYMDLHGITAGTDKGKELIAAYAAERVMPT